MNEKNSNYTDFEILPDEYPSFDMLYKIIVIGDSGNILIINKVSGNLV
jgi:hypothetical protein